MSANAGWLVDGCPLANQSLQSKVAQPHQEITPTVQCCTGAGECIHTTNDTDTEHCADKLNYHAAAIKCMGDNARLCTKEELLSVKTAGCCESSCEHVLVWTSSGHYRHYVHAGRHLRSHYSKWYATLVMHSIFGVWAGRQALVFALD